MNFKHLFVPDFSCSLDHIGSRVSKQECFLPALVAIFHPYVVGDVNDAAADADSDSVEVNGFTTTKPESSSTWHEVRLSILVSCWAS